MKKRWSLPAPDAGSGEQPVIYHCTNRVVDRRPVLGEVEKAKFVELMRACESYAGIRILSYCVLGAHFHLLLEMPPSPEDRIDDAELLRRIKLLYGGEQTDIVKQELKSARKSKSGGDPAVLEIHRQYTDRMHNLSDFIKTLNQRFTRWYNSRNARQGALWESPFRSTVIEPGTASRLVATYIELNAVRAGLVEDPADYPWCAYGEATAARKPPSAKAKRARAGLVRAFFAHEGVAADPAEWRVCHKILRQWIEQAAEEAAAVTAGRAKTRCDPEKPGAALAHRIRHFTDGVAIGRRDFIERFFELHRARFSRKRTHGAKIIRGPLAAVAKSEGLFSLRDLQKDIECC